MIFDDDMYVALNMNPKHIKIAFQGNLGSFSEIALRKKFGAEVMPCPFESFSDAYQSLLSDECHIGVLPIENTLIGTIHPSFDELVSHTSLEIIAEESIRIEHNLVAVEGSSMDSIQSVYSQWPAIDQCKDFLDTHKNWERKAFGDTAGAAKFVAEKQDICLAAISSKRAAELYGLHILASNIETNIHNFTRFVVVIKKETTLYESYHLYCKQKNLQSNAGFLVFTAHDSPGALLQCLSVFSLFKINMHKIESRPIIGKPWEYQFSVELAFENTDNDTDNNTRIIQAAQTLQHVAKKVHIVGLYFVEG